MDDGLLYFVLVLLIASSAFFSGSETALSTFNRVRMKNAAEEGDKKAKKVLKVADDYDKTLSTILIGNNIVNIASSSLATVLLLKAFPEHGALISTVIMTIVVLIFGEVSPKSMAKTRADKLAPIVAGPIDFLRTLFTPASFLLVKLTNLLNSKSSVEEQPSVTEEELISIIESIEEEGVLEEAESDLVQSALEFDEIEVQEVLTHRVDMIAMDIDDSWEEQLKLVQSEGISRFPVYEDTIDHIIGVVRAKDLLLAEVSGERDLRKLITPIMFVHSTMSISTLLNDLRRQKMQMAIVTDDYGGTLGLVTMEDCLEELVGEIWDEYDKVEEEFVDLGNDTYEVSGEMNIYDMFDNLDINTRNLESDYSTLSGWTVEQMEHIPQVGESFSYENLRVTVKEMDEQRITKLTVERFPLPETEEDED
ncbi:MAG: HlyC/CorC family transporter [Oscillospiraceae bacterium]|nr:HlyC/CorC family transporter [Oscillospiraceae bacterium]